MLNVSVLNRLICRVFGHRYEYIEGIIGLTKIIMIEECARCKDRRCEELSAGYHEIKIPHPIQQAVIYD